MGNNDQNPGEAHAQAEHTAVLAEERQKLARIRGIGETMEEGMRRFITAALKDPKVKQSLGKDGLDVMKRSEQGVNPVEAAAATTMKGFVEGHTQGDTSYASGATDVTGMEEAKWNRD